MLPYDAIMADDIDMRDYAATIPRCILGSGFFLGVVCLVLRVPS